MNILCGNCGKNSGIVKSGSDGADAAHIEQLDGWNLRLPALVGIFEWYFACSNECMKELLARAYEKHGVTVEMRAEASAKLDKMKEKIPEMAKETAGFMSQVQDRLNLIRSGYAGVMPGTGMIVDCREHPEAVPMQKNTLLKVSEQKRTK